MTTKQYLGQIDRYNKIISNKLSEIYQLKSLACSISVSADNEKIQTSSDKDRLGAAVAKIVDLESEINSTIDSFLKKREKIIMQIDSMESAIYYQVLFSRYIEQETFEKIAEETEYSLRQILRIHGRALSEFEKLYGAEYLQLCH